MQRNSSLARSCNVWHANQEFAVSPQTVGTRHKCIDCGPGVPGYYVVLPRSEINKLSGSYENPVGRIRVDGDRVSFVHYARKESKPSDYAHLIYQFQLKPQPTLVSIRFDSVYDMLHERYQREGKLTHSVAQCPERRQFSAVRLWTSTKGWKTLTLPAPTDTHTDTLSQR
jgi:hypothetical protein